MDNIRLGNRYRALRHRLDWRQEDLARRSGTTQDLVSRIERGQIAAVPVHKLRSVAHALEAEVVVQLRWRGSELDRLVDEGHAQLVGRMLEFLAATGWIARAEVSYSIFGERGSIDILAWHASTRTLLVIEVKTELVSVEETLRRHDQKVRLAPRIIEQQLGWRAASVGRLLLLPDDSTSRRRVSRHAAVMKSAYPIVGTAVRTWLRSPAGALAGILYVAIDAQRTRAGPLNRRRVRARYQPPQ